MNISKYAAAVAIIVASTFWITSRYAASQMPIAENNTLYVPAGQRAQIQLQDGTTVWLNAQSTLTYPSHFGGKERRVTLSGEAYFDVVEDTKKPFIVSTSQIVTKVLGTQFNLYSYPGTDLVQASLIEGAIQVSDINAPETTVVLKPNEQVSLKEGKMEIGTIRHPEKFLWKDGIYSFDNERLEDIVKKLELYYDVKINIENPQLKEIPYTCKFRQRDGIDEILQILNRIKKFDIKKDKEQNIITLN